MQISSIPRLSFFKAEKYEYHTENVCDFCKSPRPHTCMGLLLDGSAEFHINGEKIPLSVGDIIFVPITSEYVSYWKGSPDIRYISMHFIFDSPNGLFTPKKPLLQKITPKNFDECRADYEFILNNFDAEDESVQFEVLGRFYKIISMTLPQLKYKSKKDVDARLNSAREYIDLNYDKNISIAELAKNANMSISNFHASFKKYFGTAPIEYKNKVCINHAIRMLIEDKNRSIEEISEQLGFSSSTYFRRVFRSITGQSPREYKKNSLCLFL